MDCLSYYIPRLFLCNQDLLPSPNSVYKYISKCYSLPSQSLISILYRTVCFLVGWCNYLDLAKKERERERACISNRDPFFFTISGELLCGDAVYGCAVKQGWAVSDTICDDILSQISLGKIRAKKFKL